MKVAISTTSDGLEDKVSEVFGRAESFTIMEVENREIKNVEGVKNEFAEKEGGVGV